MTLQPLAVYVHLPFCTKKCDYCAFNSGPVDAAIRAKYLGLLPREFDRFREAYPHYPREAYTIFLGGGTPSVLTPGEMDTLLDALFEAFPGAEEITCEVNPQSANEPLLRLLRERGVTRISIGLQTFDARLLEAYGRAHGVSEFRETYEQVRALEFPHLSFDLLYGHPDQTLQMLDHDLDEALALAPSHISLYGLKVEPNTPFARTDIEGRQDGDLMADMYMLIRARLEGVGVTRYELSNFAKAGHESRHNRAYWQMRDWVGFGLDAHSLLRMSPEAIPQPMGREGTYSKWFGGLEEGRDTLVRGMPLDAEAFERTSLIMGLRLREGVGAGEFHARFGNDLRAKYGPTLAPFESYGLVAWTSDERVCLTEEGVYVSNSVFAALI